MSVGLALLTTTAAAQDQWDVDLAQETIAGTGGGGQEFGKVLAAGDLNGDTFDDIVIGAPGANSGDGEVLIVFGTAGEGAIDESAADWTLRDSTNGESLASALLVADIDGDGHNDLVVGCSDCGSSNWGEVWIFEGPLSKTTTAQTRADADHVIVGDAGDRLGNALDHRKMDDGSDDEHTLVIGARAGNSLDGVVYLIDSENDLTSATLTASATAHTIFEGDSGSDEELGHSVALTPHGLAVGAPGHEVGSDEVGRVYYWAWSDGGSWPASGTTATGTVTGDGGAERLGVQVEHLGYINSAPTNPDGYPADPNAEHVVGIVAKEGHTTAGDVFFLPTRFGFPTTSFAASALGAMSSGPSTAPHVAPKLLVGVGDYDGDDLQEFFFTDSNVAHGALRLGSAYLIEGIASDFSSGTKSVVTRARFEIAGTGGPSWQEFGNSVTAGDINGDGRMDLVIGSSRPAGSDVDEGGVSVYYGPFRPTEGTDVSLPPHWQPTTAVLDADSHGDFDGAFAGTWVEGVGDVNCDGIDDVAIGAPYELTSSPPDERAGTIYLHFGASRDEAFLEWEAGQSLFFSASALIRGGDDGDGLGRAFGLGDIDGDGCDDLMVTGHSVHSGATADVGAAYLFYGAADGTSDAFNPSQNVSEADATFLHSVADAALGTHVAVVDDLDGDGRSELAISAVADSSGGADAGATYLYHVGTSRFTNVYTPRSDADCVIDGAAGEDFGNDVIAFDVDDDGDTDLAVGAPGALSSAGSISTGSVFVWTTRPCEGRFEDSTSYDVRFDGRDEDARFGTSLAVLGPFDDGQDEIAGLAVGAPFDGPDPDRGPVVMVVPGNKTSGVHVAPAGGFEVCDNDRFGRFGFSVASGNMSWDEDDGNSNIYEESAELELFVGAPSYDFRPSNFDELGNPLPPRGTWLGRAYGFEGHAMRGLLGATGCALDVDTPDDGWWVVEGTQDYGTVGYSIGTCDLNRDGFDDVVIGEPGWDTSSSSSGLDRGRAVFGLSTQDIKP